MTRARSTRLWIPLALAVCASLPRNARAECENERWPSCHALDGAALVIGGLGFPQYVRIPVGESEASGVGINVSVGYRYRSLVLLGEFLGVYDEPLTAHRSGVTARLILWHLPTTRHLSTMVYVEGGLGRQHFRWEADDGTIERTLHRTDAMLGLGVAESFRIGDAFAYRISLGARAFAARRPFPTDTTDATQQGERCSVCVDRGYAIVGNMSFDF